MLHYIHFQLGQLTAEVRMLRRDVDKLKALKKPEVSTLERVIKAVMTIAAPIGAFIKTGYAEKTLDMIRALLAH